MAAVPICSDFRAQEEESSWLLVYRNTKESRELSKNQSMAMVDWGAI